jgi:hypothetical protein
MRTALFREVAPMTAAAAATVILDGVKADRWRILVGEDAKQIDDLGALAARSDIPMVFPGINTTVR